MRIPLQHARQLIDEEFSLNFEMLILHAGGVPGRGLEPLRIAPPDPKSGASANFATLACCVQIIPKRFLYASANKDGRFIIVRKVPRKSRRGTAVAIRRAQPPERVDGLLYR